MKRIDYFRRDDPNEYETTTQSFLTVMMLMVDIMLVGLALVVWLVY